VANKDPSKTEKATAKKRNEVRKDGKIPVSQDITSVVVIVGTVLLLYVTAPYFVAGIARIFQDITSLETRQDWTQQEIFKGALTGLYYMAAFGAPILIGIILLSFIPVRTQVGSFFELKPLQWKFDSMNPVSGFKQILPSVDNTVKLLLTMAKVFIIAIFVYFLIRSEFENILYLPLQPEITGATWMIKKCMVLALKIMIIFVFLAIIDLIWKRKQHEDNIMMAKYEVKDEQRSAEGDPLVKSKIRNKMRALLAQSIVDNIRRSNVVVTNPTHVAVALKYEDGDFAPRVMVKGLRKRAELIKRLARQNGIPIMEVPPLARGLYRAIPAGSYIKHQFFAAVASVLARLHKRNKTRKHQAVS